VGKLGSQCEEKKHGAIEVFPQRQNHFGQNYYKPHLRLVVLPLIVLPFNMAENFGIKVFCKWSKIFSHGNEIK
jgi:hypothetical protein